MQPTEPKTPRAERWALSLSLREGLIKVALGMCGLETTSDGQVQRTESEPRPAPREKLAAMRVIASYDKLSIDERKVELREKAAGLEPKKRRAFEFDPSEVSPEVGTEVLMLMINSPPPPPKPKPEPEPENQAELELAASVQEARWSLSIDVRGAIVETAANLCGLGISDEGTVAAIPVTEDSPAPQPLIKLGALRVIARFDRLSLEHRRLKLWEWRWKKAQPLEREKPEVDPAVQAKIDELIREDVRKHRTPGYVPTELEANPVAWWLRKGPERS